MSVLKLANAGETATLDITACEVVEGQYGEQVLFKSGEDDLYLPRTSADRQLERLGFASNGDMDYDAVVGLALTFSRAPNPKAGSKPFWNIAKATNGTAPVAAVQKPKPAAKPPVEYVANKPQSEIPPLLRNAEAEDEAEFRQKVGVDPASLPKDAALYVAITEFVLRDIAPIYEKSKIGMSPESAAAAVATIFIQAKR